MPLTRRAATGLMLAGLVSPALGQTAPATVKVPTRGFALPDWLAKEPRVPATALLEDLRARGFELLGGHHAHALHSPFWWLKCAVGDGSAVRAYHKLLVWDITARPRLTRWAERGLNPVLGKSVVLYLRKPGSRPS